MLNSLMTIKFGDIFWFGIPTQHTVGSEQRKERPWVVVSRTELNGGRMVSCVPLTSKLHKACMHRLQIPASFMIPEPGETKLKTSVALTDQVRAVDRDRLGPKVGEVTTQGMNAIQLGLKFLFRLSNPVASTIAAKSTLPN